MAETRSDRLQDCNAAVATALENLLEQVDSIESLVLSRDVPQIEAQSIFLDAVREARKALEMSRGVK